MSWRVICADVMDGLAQLADESVQTVVTSPPYWGLRDYGTAAWDGGDVACDHIQPVSYANSTLGASTGGRSVETHGRSVGAQASPYRNTCGKCGAVRIDQQLGLEPTPEAYVERMVEVFREIRRVLRSDGTVWLNLGDSYATTPPGGIGHNASVGSTRAGVQAGGLLGHGLKPKDLVGIPWRVAFALQADGWWLRSDIIWAKPNPMPESVTDRPTKSHEMIFLLAKSARYFFDADAVREPLTRPDLLGKSRLSGVVGLAGQRGDVGRQHDYADPAGRNIRSVWNIATEPFPLAHFATFPKALVEPCVKAGSAAGDTVLDPFCGSGTTGVVALRLGRSFVGIELSETYAQMARNRITDDAPLFNTTTEFFEADLLEQR